MKIFPVYPLFPIEILRARGANLWDSNNNSYLDFYGGHAVISIGHSHKKFISDMKQQLDNLIFYSNSIIIRQQDRLAELLGNISNCENYSLFLCNSGAEANENALKMASFYNSRSAVLSFRNSFHGRTSLAVSATDNSTIAAPINCAHNTTFLPLNDLEALDSAFDNTVCAVIIEGIQGVGGIYAPSQEFLRAIRNHCDRHDAIMIVDEIQSGYGRSGDFFAYQFSGIQPDIISIAKGMGNGFPIGGILLSEKFSASNGMLGTTFGGNHLACAAGISTLEIIVEEDLMGNAKKMGNYLLGQLSSFSEIVELRGRGLMIGIEMKFPIEPLRRALLEKYRIFVGNSSNKNTLRLLPPLCITQEQCDYFLESFYSELQQTTA